MRRLSTLLITSALLCAPQMVSVAGTPYVAAAQQEMNFLEERYDIKLSVKAKKIPIPLKLKGTFGVGNVELYWTYIIGKKKILSGDLVPGNQEFYIDAPFVEDSYVKATIEQDGALSSFEICEVEEDEKGTHPGFCYIKGTGTLTPHLHIDYSYVNNPDARGLYRINLAPNTEDTLAGYIERVNDVGASEKTVEKVTFFKGHYKQKHK